MLILIIGTTISKAEDTPGEKTLIKGHWNYPKNSVQKVKVVSEGEDVELLINGITFGHGEKECDSIFVFDKVIFQPGDLTAISYDKNGKEISRHTLQTAGQPAQLKLTVNQGKEGFRANGSDIAILQFEVEDFQGKLCGADDRIVSLEIEGPVEWGGQTPSQSVNLVKELPVVNGTNRTFIKSTNKSGEIKITAKAKGLAPVSINLNSLPVNN